MTTTAKITAKGTNDTGITEDLAEKLHNQLGRKVLAIVELVAESRTEKRNGDETVTLSILTVEPAPNNDTEDHLRELARAFHYERQLADGQLTINTTDDLEPKVKDVLTAGTRHRPHPFLPDDAANERPICDICGQLETAPNHSTQNTLDDDPDNEEDEGNEGNEGNDEQLDLDNTDDQDNDDNTPENDDNTTPFPSPFAIA